MIWTCYVALLGERPVGHVNHPNISKTSLLWAPLSFLHYVCWLNSFFFYVSQIANSVCSGWWYTYPSEKYENQLGLWNSQSMENNPVMFQTSVASPRPPRGCFSNMRHPKTRFGVLHQNPPHIAIEQVDKLQWIPLISSSNVGWSSHKTSKFPSFDDQFANWYHGVPQFSGKDNQL